MCMGRHRSRRQRVTALGRELPSEPGTKRKISTNWTTLDPGSRSRRASRRTSRLFRVTRFCVIALLGITLAAAIGGAVCPIGRLIG